MANSMASIKMVRRCMPEDEKRKEIEKLRNNESCRV